MTFFKMIRTLMFASLPLVAAEARAGLLNGGFEGPAIADNSAAGGAIAGWTGSTDQSYYFGVTREYGLIPTPVEGRQVAFVNNFDSRSGLAVDNAISQTLSDVLSPGLAYTFSAYFGWRNDNAESVGGLEIWAGGTASAGKVNGGTLLASKSVKLARGMFVKGSLTYLATDLSPFLGQPISVRLTGLPVADGFAQTNFDDAEFTSAPAPEPSTFAAAGFGALAALRAWNRRNNRRDV